MALDCRDAAEERRCWRARLWVSDSLRSGPRAAAADGWADFSMGRNTQFVVMQLVAYAPLAPEKFAPMLVRIQHGGKLARSNAHLKPIKAMKHMHDQHGGQVALPQSLSLST